MYISGTILKSTPMVQIDGKFIDGYNVSVTCYDITQTEVKALTLSCGNLSINDGIQATDSHAHSNVLTLSNHFLITGFEIRVPQRVPLVEQELLTLSFGATNFTTQNCSMV
jgi:hypothetical protein